MKPGAAVLVLPLALATLGTLVACDDSTDGGGGSTSSSTSSTSASGSTSGSGSTSSSSTGAGMGMAKFGDTCVSDTDCLSHVCVDVKDADDGCTSGKYCTIPCTTNAECAGALGADDCTQVNGVEVCLETDWFTAHGCN